MNMKMSKKEHRNKNENTAAIIFVLSTKNTATKIKTKQVSKHTLLT